MFTKVLMKYYGDVRIVTPKNRCWVFTEDEFRLWARGVEMSYWEFLTDYECTNSLEILTDTAWRHLSTANLLRFRLSVMVDRWAATGDNNAAQSSFVLSGLLAQEIDSLISGASECEGLCEHLWFPKERAAWWHKVTAEMREPDPKYEWKITKEKLPLLEGMPCRQKGEAFKSFM